MKNNCNVKFMDTHISCSVLVKNSAKAIVFKKNRTRQRCFEEKPSQKMLSGVDHQLKVATSEYQEMRGCYEHGKHKLYFSFDEVALSGEGVTFIEHKNIGTLSELEQWYVEYSILQVALYSSLASKIDYLQTATFFTKQGNPFRKIDLKKENRKSEEYLLVFSDGYDKKTFSIEVKRARKIIDFYLNKLEHTLVDSVDISYAYSAAEQWDTDYKGREYKKLKKYIKVSEVEYGSVET